MITKFRNYQFAYCSGALLSMVSSWVFAGTPQFSVAVSPQKLVVGQPTNITYTLTNTGPDINNFYIQFDTKDRVVLIIKNGSTQTRFSAGFGTPGQQPCPNSASTSSTFKSQTSCSLVLTAAPPIIGNLLVPSGKAIYYSLNGTATTASFPNYTQQIIPSALYNFGDSYSDNGNLSKWINGKAVPNNPDPNKWTALVSADMGYTNLPSRLGGTNYAIGGSISGPIAKVSVVNGQPVSTIRELQIADDPANKGLSMHLLAQVGRVIAANPLLDPNAIYFIWSGGNDLGTYQKNYALYEQYNTPAATMTNQIVPTDASQMATNLYTAVTQLQNAGARFIVLATQADSTSSDPYVRTLPGLVNTQVNTLISNLNDSNSSNPNYYPVQLVNINSIFAPIFVSSSANCGFLPLFAGTCVTQNDPNCTSANPTGICCSSTAMAKAVIPFLSPKMCGGDSSKSPKALFLNNTSHPTYAGHEFLAINFEQLLFLPQPKL